MTSSPANSISQNRCAQSSKSPFRPTRLSIIEEGKYEKHKHQQNEERKLYVTGIMIFLAILSLWHCMSRAIPSIAGLQNSVEDPRLQSLRSSRNPYNKSQMKAMNSYFEENAKPGRNKDGLDETMKKHIEALKHYERNVEAREQEYQDEVKALIEDELRQT